LRQTLVKCLGAFPSLETITVTNEAFGNVDDPITIDLDDIEHIGPLSTAPNG
jgi:hypothetical protein